MDFVVYPQRVKEVLGELMRAYYTEQHPFVPGVMEFPQEEHKLPPSLERGGIQEANYFIGLCNYMLGAAASLTMAERYVKLFEANSMSMFDYSITQHMSEAEITTALQDAGLGFRSTEVPKAWIENAKRIQSLYDGDIRRLFETAGSDWRELHRLIRSKNGDGLVGYQAKMASMLAFFLMRRDVVEYFVVPPPVDFHVMRVFWSTKMVVPVDDDGQEIQALKGNYILHYADRIRETLVQYELETGQNWLDLSDALWTQSRTMCRFSPSNSMSKGEYAARSTKLWQDPITWTPLQRRRYRMGCGRCSLQEHCTQALPSAYYYSWGELRLHGPRQSPPPEEGTLFNPD